MGQWNIGIISKSYRKRLLMKKCLLILSCSSVLVYIPYVFPAGVSKFMTARSFPANAFPVNASRLHITILKRPFIISNQELCSGTVEVNHIIIVHSSTGNFERRQSLRKTWANPKVFSKLNAKTVFILGKASSEEIQEKIVTENEKYGDIVQGDFLDHYDNLTLKALTGFRWISEHCNNSQSVIKVDDDVFVDIFRVVYNYLPILRLYPKRLICWAIMGGTIFRQDAEPELRKWIVPDELFPGYDRYPMPFCLGMSVFLSARLAKQLLLASNSAPFFRMDDVYMYGILASMVPGVTWQNEEYWMTKVSPHEHWVYRFYSQKSRYIVETSRNFEEMNAMWDAARESSSVEQ